MHHHMIAASYIPRESWVWLLLLPCTLMMCGNNWIHYGPMDALVSLFVCTLHYIVIIIIDVSGHIELPGKCIIADTLVHIHR